MKLNQINEPEVVSISGLPGSLPPTFASLSASNSLAFDCKPWYVCIPKLSVQTLSHDVDPAVIAVNIRASPACRPGAHGFQLASGRN